MYATQGLALRALRKIRKRHYATHALRALRNVLTQRTQRNELLHGKDRPTMYKIATFKVAVLFVLL